MRRQVAFGLAVVLVAVSGLSCDRKRREEPAPFPSAPFPTGDSNEPRSGQLFAIGERAEVPELVVTVDGKKECNSDHLRPGNVLLGVELSVEGRSESPVPFNPFHCKLHDSSGTSWTPTLQGCEPRLRDHRLTQGERAEGWVTFELPKRAKELKLVCALALLGNETRTLRFDLESR